MKKILIFIAAIILSIGAFGQDLNKTNLRMMLDEINAKLAAGLIDSIGTVTVGGKYPIFVGADTAYWYEPVSESVQIGSVAWLLVDTVGGSGRDLLITPYQLATATLDQTDLEVKSEINVIHTFNAGNGLAGDTSRFAAGSLLGSFFNRSADTIVVTDVISAISTGDTLSYHILYADTLNALNPTHVTDTIVIDNYGENVETETFENDTIPPDKWVYAKAIGTEDGANPIYFASTLSGYKIKGTYDSTVTNVISDGHTLAWYKFDDLSTVTKDGSNLVAEWADYLMSGRDLIQATGTNQPEWKSTGIEFNGSDNFMKTDTFAYDQPIMIYMVLNPITSTSGDVVYDGYAAANIVYFFQNAVSPSVTLKTSSTIIDATTATTNTYHIYRCLINGTSSKLVIDAVETTGSLTTGGTYNIGGFTLGSTHAGGSCSNIAVKEIILRNIVDSEEDEEYIYNYLKDKYGL